MIAAAPKVPGCRRGLALAASALAVLLCATRVDLSLAGPPPLAPPPPEPSLARAVQGLLERTGGRLLRAETQLDDGRTHHRVRVLLDGGRVRTYRLTTPATPQR